MNQFAETLDRIIVTATPQLKELDVEEFGIRPAQGKWSPKEILGHLIDSAYNNHQRFLRAAHQDNLIFRGYDQINWVNLNQYQRRAKDEILFTWVTVNQHLSILIEGLSDDLLEDLTTDHNFHEIGMHAIAADQPASLGYLIWDYLHHLEHHLSQLLPAYIKINGPNPLVRQA